MKLIPAFLVLYLIVGPVCGQTRIFLSAGGSLLTEYGQNEYYFPKYGNSINRTDGSYSKKGLKYFTFDIEVERKINKFAFVSGLRFFNSGYSNHFAMNFSKLDCSHIGVPLLFRVNLLNYLYLDLGAIGVYTAKANLDETAVKGSPNQLSDQKDIARYLPFRLGINIQYSIVINRYFISGYFIIVNNQVSEKFASSWNLGGNYRNNSLFLRDLNPHYQVSLIGIKMGMRIR
jgi:hypothetical protein